MKKTGTRSQVKLQLEIVTLFPNFFESPLRESIMKRAQEDGKISVQVHNLRDYTKGKHKTADDKPFGGGPGMLMKPEPIFECIESVTGFLFDEKKKKLVARKKGRSKEKPWIILLDPKGDPLSQKIAKKLASKKHILLIAGHYEGVDHRVREYLIDQEISVGDYITMGGEAPALCLMESVVRLIPGVLGNHESIEDESFQKEGLEYPHYTRPRSYRGMDVPEVLISGHHREIEKWRKQAAQKVTSSRRPDLV